MEVNKIYNIDVIEFMSTLPDESIDLVVTDPPYLISYKPNESIEYHSSLGIKREKRKLAELQAFFEYIEINKHNLFDLCGLHGELT